MEKQVNVLQTNSVLVIAQQTVMTLDVSRTYTLQVKTGEWTGFLTDKIDKFVTIASIELITIWTILDATYSNTYF